MSVFKLKCVGYNSNEYNFTIDKVYEFNNGHFVCDDGFDYSHFNWNDKPYDVIKWFEDYYDFVLADEDESKVKKVIFNPPATIIIWNDNTKTVVQCQNGETFDAEKGFALAYLKKLLGNDNTFNKEINKWVEYECSNDKPLTIEQLKKMQGKKVFIVSLNVDGKEDFHTDYSGWHTVKGDILIKKNDDYYFITDNGTEFGYHAYLKERKKND